MTTGLRASLAFSRRPRLATAAMGRKGKTPCCDMRSIGHNKGAVDFSGYLSSFMSLRFSSTVPNNDKNKHRRRLDVAIVGAPNAGKSQLLNCLTQSNVAAVSRKRHTTRDGVLGARTIDNTQLVFIDTPGFLRAKSAKQEGLLKDLMASAQREMRRADYTLLVVDAAKRLTDSDKEALVTLMLQAKYSQGRIEVALDDDEDADVSEPIDLEKFALVLNKIDLVHPKERLLELATELGTIADETVLFDGKDEGEKDNQLSPDQLELLAEASPPIFYISALQNDGVGDVLKHLLNRATPSKQWPVAPHESTDQSVLERIEEVIREKIYRTLHKEVPHSVTQVNKSLQKLTHRDTGQTAVRIDQDLVIKTKSHKRLLYGKGGKTLRRIQQAAARDIARMLGCDKVILNLHVKLSKSQYDQQLDATEYGMQNEFIK